MDISYKTVSNQGERVLVGDNERLIKEHAVRYEFCVSLLPPKARVLDCACGSGYGTDILGKEGHSVLGVDISSVSIEFCRHSYGAPNVTFSEGNAEALDFHDESFDAFVSFETIEHVQNPDRVAKEAWRVLRPGGIFVVSTPNRVASNLLPGQQPHNPFHVFEWSLREMDFNLRRYFNNIQYFGQHVRSRNKLHPMYVTSKWKRLLGFRDISSMKTSPDLFDKMESPKYWQPLIFIACCTK